MDDGRSLRVAQDGSGDYRSVQAGVDAASDGDRLLIGPGEYPEPVRIDKLLEVVGAGRGRTVLGAAASTEPALRIAAIATIRRLTIVGSEQFYRDPQYAYEDLPNEEGDTDPLELAVYGGRPHQAALLIDRGRTTLEDIEVVTASGPAIRVSASCDVLADDCAVLPAADSASKDGATGEPAIIIDDGAATLTGCTIRGELGLVGQSSMAIVSRSRLLTVRASGSLTVHDSDTRDIVLGFCRATLIGNRITASDQSRTVMLGQGSTVLLAGNSITGPGGIVVHGAGTVAVIVGNSIGADRICIRLQHGASALVEGNRLHDAEVGVRVAGESTRARMRRNDVAVRGARVECASGGRVDDDGD